MKLLLSIFFSLAVICGTARAEGLYATVGISHIGVGGESSNMPTFSLGYKVGLASFEIGPFWSGDMTSETLLRSTTQLDFSRRTRSMSGYRISALFSMPLTEQAIAFASVSAYSVKSTFETLHQSIALPSATLLSSTSSSFSSTETLPAFGFGLRYNFTNWSARASYERIDPKSGMFGIGNDLDKIAVTTVAFVLSF